MTSGSSSGSGDNSSSDGFDDWANALSLLGNPQRLRVLIALHGHPGAHAGELVQLSQVSRNYVSRTLASCERAGLVTATTVGKTRHYELTHVGVHRVLHELGAPHTALHTPHDH